MIYIYENKNSWLVGTHDIEKIERLVSPQERFVGTFDENNPEEFWKFITEKEKWYPINYLVECIESFFNTPNPVNLCAVIRSKRSGKVLVGKSKTKISGDCKWKNVHVLPTVFCYKQSAVKDVFSGMLYLLRDKKRYSDLEFMKEIDTGDETYLVYKTECEYDKREDEDTWVLPSEIIPTPRQEAIVDYLRQAF